MFDTHIHRATPNYPQQINSTVVEKRAPTDESVRLLREMEQTARDNILLAIKSNDNAFKFTAVVYSDNFHLTRKLHVRYSVNGEQLELEREVKATDTPKDIFFAIQVGIEKQLAKLAVISIAERNVIVNCFPA